MNSVCFVQSCRTLWDTAFLLMVYLMFPQEGSEALYCNFVRSAGSQVEVKVFSLLFLRLPFHFYFFCPRVCVNVLISFSLHIYIKRTLIGSHVFSPVDEDTEGSSRSGRESMSTSGDLFVGPGLNGSLSKDDRRKDRDKIGGSEKKPERDKDREKDKDKNKAKKGVLKGLGEMFR